jgi:DNA modification methylase
LTDPDSVPEVPDQPVTRRGDLWQLGDHRVSCGDSTNPADVAQVLAGSQPQLMIADPPYGVGYEPSWRARRGLSAGKLAQGKVASPISLMTTRSMPLAEPWKCLIRT